MPRVFAILFTKAASLALIAIFLATTAFSHRTKVGTISSVSETHSHSDHHENFNEHSSDGGLDDSSHAHEHQHSPNDASHSHRHQHNSEAGHSDSKIAYSPSYLHVEPNFTVIKVLSPSQVRSSVGYLIGIFRPPIS